VDVLQAHLVRARASGGVFARSIAQPRERGADDGGSVASLPSNSVPLLLRALVRMMQRDLPLCYQEAATPKARCPHNHHFSFWHEASFPRSAMTASPPKRTWKLRRD